MKAISRKRLVFRAKHEHSELWSWESSAVVLSVDLSQQRIETLMVASLYSLDHLSYLCFMYFVPFLYLLYVFTFFMKSLTSLAYVYSYILLKSNLALKKKLYKENVCLNQYFIVRCFIRTVHYHHIYYSPAGEKRKIQLHKRKKITIKKNNMQKSVM